TDHHRNRKGDEDPLEGGPHVPPQPSPLHFPPQELQRFPGSGKHGRPQQVGEQQPGGKNRQQRGQQPPARRVAGARGGPPPGAFYGCCRCVRCCHGCRPPFRPFHCTLHPAGSVAARHRRRRRNRHRCCPNANSVLNASTSSFSVPTNSGPATATIASTSSTSPRM